MTTINALWRKLSYDPATGVLKWLPREGLEQWSARFAGTVAGHTSKRGYVTVQITENGEKFTIKAHRLIVGAELGRFLLPHEEVDHRDGDPSNNRRDNLRLCNKSNNQKNQALSKNNTTGFKGVRRYPRTNRFTAAIQLEGKLKHIGMFNTAQDAAAAYDDYATRHFGEFARTNRAMGLL